MELRIESVSHPVLDRLRASTRRLYTAGSIRILPSGCVFNTSFEEHVTRVTTFNVHQDDTWVVTFPKTGTTWTQEMAWLIVNNLDFEGAKEKTLEMRFPYLEFSCTFTAGVDDALPSDTVDYAASLPSPRCIKSHLPKQLLPTGVWDKKVKIIYVYRDPKDVAVSYYYHNCLINGYTGTKAEFYEAFMEGVVMFCPFWEHVLEFWKLRDERNVFFNTFDEMKQDLPGVIRKMACFLDKTLSEEDVTRLAEHLSFSRMRDNPSVNCNHRRPTWEAKKLTTLPDLKFIRRGESGGWRNEMTPDMAKRFDEWTREKLGTTGFPYTYCDCQSVQSH